MKKIMVFMTIILAGACSKDETQPPVIPLLPKAFFTVEIAGNKTDYSCHIIALNRNDSIFLSFTNKEWALVSSSGPGLDYSLDFNFRKKGKGLIGDYEFADSLRNYPYKEIYNWKDSLKSMTVISGTARIDSTTGENYNKYAMGSMELKVRKGIDTALLTANVRFGVGANEY